MTPEEVLKSVVEGITIGDRESLMTIYESLACFASQPGQLAKVLMVYEKACTVSLI
jgi:hypothetical protein